MSQELSLIPTYLPEVLMVKSNLFKDDRGTFYRAFDKEFFAQKLEFTLSQINISFTKDIGTIRGLHFQGQPHQLSKIVSIVQGSAIDYLLDLREESPTFLNVFVQPLGNGTDLSIFIPKGVAHGYLSLEENTIMSYKFDEAYCKNCDNGVSGEIIKQFIPIEFDTTIKSEKDSNLSFTLGQIPPSICKL